MATSLSEFFLHRRYLIWLILAVNFFSALYGYYWYRYQLAATPWYLWPFVPDCPLAATLMAAALAVYLFAGRKDTWFQFLTYTVLLKYGFWTVFVFLLYWAAGGKQYSIDYLMLFVSHAGMLAEGAVFLGSAPQRPAFWWLAAGWSAVDVVFDYFYPFKYNFLGRRGIGVYPYLPNETHRPVILVMTVAITACFLIVAMVVTMRAKARKPRSI